MDIGDPGLGFRRAVSEFTEGAWRDIHSACRAEGEMPAR